MFVSHKSIPGYSFAISFPNFKNIPEVSLKTLGFSQTVTFLYPNFLAYSKAALIILLVYFFVTILVEIAISSLGTLAKPFILG